MRAMASSGGILAKGLLLATSITLTALCMHPVCAWANANPPEDENITAMEVSDKDAPSTSVASKLDKTSGTGASANANSKSESTKSDAASTADSTGAFSFAGTGTTVDKATEADGVDFLTFTADDQTYYLVVDHTSNTKNVYLLTQADKSDLQALAKSGVINLNDTTAPATTATEEEKPAEKEKDDGEGQIPAPLAYAILLALAGGGAYAYYRLKLKPEREENEVSQDEIDEFERGDTQAFAPYGSDFK